MDVGCYCVSGARLVAGEPERVSAEQATRRRRRRRRVRRDDALPRRRARALRRRPRARRLATSWRSSATRARCSSTTRGTAVEPVIELRRDDDVERIEIEPVNSYRLEAENLSAAIRGEAAPLLGRDDALGQARAIEALYEAADSGPPVALS